MIGKRRRKGLISVGENGGVAELDVTGVEKDRWAQRFALGICVSLVGYSDKAACS